MGCGDVRLLRTIGGLDVTGQERAALNKLTMPILDIVSTFRKVSTKPDQAHGLGDPASAG